MTEPHSIEEILLFAMQKEEASYCFYTDMAASARDPQTAKLFNEIAQDEIRHRQQLLLELMKVGRVVDTTQDWTERSAADYVVEGELPRDLTLPEALQLAQSKEHASYRLYVDLIRLTKDQQAMEVFMALAEEEIRHKLSTKTTCE